MLRSDSRLDIIINNENDAEGSLTIIHHSLFLVKPFCVCMLATMS
jgi:hypothetical protein